EDPNLGRSKLVTATLHRITGDSSAALADYYSALRALQFKRQPLETEEGTPSGGGKINELLTRVNRGEGLLHLPSERPMNSIACFEAAMSEFQLVEEAGGQSPRLELEKARVLSERSVAKRLVGQNSGAREDANLALETLNAIPADKLELSTVEDLRSRMLFRRGQIRRALTEFEPAIADFEAALQQLESIGQRPENDMDLRPRIAETHAEIGKTLLDAGQVDSGRAKLEQVAVEWRGLTERYPRAWRFHEKIAEVYERLGQTELADAARAKAKEHKPLPKVSEGSASEHPGAGGFPGAHP
ncbi:MAG: hypothetical protein NT069_18965, partial [Planctomycetota bacterium]|nr:hypothetical protein [Planctomycetota bacterium]